MGTSRRVSPATTKNPEGGKAPEEQQPEQQPQQPEQQPEQPTE